MRKIFYSHYPATDVQALESKIYRLDAHRKERCPTKEELSYVQLHIAGAKYRYSVRSRRLPLPRPYRWYRRKRGKSRPAGRLSPAAGKGDETRVKRVAAMRARGKETKKPARVVPAAAAVAVAEAAAEAAF